MNLEVIKSAVTSKAARQLLLARKYSPQALFVAGTVGVIGATVLACRATLKMDQILEDHEKQLGDIGEGALAVDALNSDEYRRDVIKLKVKTGVEIGKLYAPAIALGTVSIAALTGSHVVLTKRNGAAMAAYAGLNRAYAEYRKRVSDEYGADVDRKFALGGENVTVEEKTAEGKIKKTDRIVHTGRGGSPYAALFDEKSKHFTLEPGMNAVILGVKQSHMNDKLRAQGHLFLNEVYDDLGLPRTKAGQFVGWVWRSDDEMQKLRDAGQIVGDNYVSFGIYENDPIMVDQFMTGNNPVWLDFNVDGPIFELI